MLLIFLPVKKRVVSFAFTIRPFKVGTYIIIRVPKIFGIFNNNNKNIFKKIVSIRDNV